MYYTKKIVDKSAEGREMAGAREKSNPRKGLSGLCNKA